MGSGSSQEVIELDQVDSAARQLESADFSNGSEEQVKLFTEEG